MNLTTKQIIKLIKLCEKIITHEFSYKYEVDYIRDDEEFIISILSTEREKWYRYDPITYSHWQIPGQFTNCRSDLKQIIKELDSELSCKQTII